MIYIPIALKHALAVDRLLLIGFIVVLPCRGVATQTLPANTTEIAWISDTQQLLWTEHLSPRKNRNAEATRLLFADIAQHRFNSLFMAGDVVALGFSEKKWKQMDQYLDTCRNAGIQVHAEAGNHDVMLRPRKGEARFAQRFPGFGRTGSVHILDSVAFVLLNSNFKHLSKQDIRRQQDFYAHTLHDLDADPRILAVVVSCHHAPYSNSRTVGCSRAVQEKFVPLFLQSSKCRVFMTGHAHLFEHFTVEGKDFVVIGGGGGIRQPLVPEGNRGTDHAATYKPEFHYLILQRNGLDLFLRSRFLQPDFSGIKDGYAFTIKGNGQ